MPMRNTDPIASIDLADLATVTGGCKKKCASSPPPQAQPQMAPQSDGGVSVEVATGAQGGAAIQQAMQGGAAPRLI